MGRRNGVPTVKSRIENMPISDADNTGVVIECGGKSQAVSSRSSVYAYGTQSGKSFTTWLDGPYANGGWAVLIKRIS